MSDEKRKVLVTGASGGIGRAIAIACGKAGYYVIAHYGRSKEKGEAVLAEIKSAGGEGELVQFDVADRADCETKLNALTEKHGALWGIINNAGITRDNTFVGLKGEDWDAVIRTNLDSFFNVTHPLAMPMCRAKKGGRVIAISSVSGVMGNRGQANYSAAKSGLIGAVKALAMDLASRNITVNAIAPGIIETDMIKDAPVEYIMQSVPLARAGKPEEVAALAVFLLSDDAAYITRQCIGINGGMA